MKGGDRFYRFSRVVVTALAKLFFRLTWRGAEYVPAQGGVLLACNHVSFLDPPLVGCALRHRVVRFMARQDLFEPRLLRWLLRRFQCVPVDRTRGDVGALRKAIQLLRSGEVVCIFPEGTRSPDGELHPAKPGVGFLVAKACVPVVPVYLHGAYEAWPRHAKLPRPRKIHVIFGPPITPEEIARLGHGDEAYRAIAELIMQRIAELKAQAA